MFDSLFSGSQNVAVHGIAVLPALIALEVVLSADNAIALGALTQGIREPALQRKALTIGIAIAYVFRVVLILSASVMLRFWQFQLAGAIYLLWLSYRYFTIEAEAGQRRHALHFTSVWQAIPMIALTDLAFSLDSVTAAMAISPELWVILVGGTIGVIALRFMAGLFVRWLQEFSHLEDAGFATVALVGLQMLIRVNAPELVLPQWLTTFLIAFLFLWGFSKRMKPAQ